MVNSGTNDIPALQNAPENLRRLAAQRRLYTRAKRWMAVIMIASVAVPVVLALLAVWLPALRAWAAVYGIAITILDIALVDDVIKHTQRCAAAIQEDFDCDVLRVGRNPLVRAADADAELVAAMAGEQARLDPEFRSLRDWYAPTVGALPLPLARLLCQRINLRWDKRLRTTYARGLLCLVILLGMFIACLGLYTGCTVETLVVRVLAPVLPVLVWGVREYKRQASSADGAGKLKLYAESAWERALDGTLGETEAERVSRTLQDAIFERRSNGPMVFDWVYQQLKRRYEHEAGLGAEDMVRQAKARLGLS